MSCPTCDQLREKLADAHQALSAWEQYDAARMGDAEVVARLGRWQMAFRLTMAEASILLALVDAAGRALASDILLLASRAAGRCGDVESNLVQTMVYRIRRSLDRVGQGDAVQTLIGIGYMVPTLAAEALKAVADD